MGKRIRNLCEKGTKISQHLVLVLCFVGFFYTFRDHVVKFLAKKRTTTTYYDRVETLTFPNLMFCRQTNLFRFPRGFVPEAHLTMEAWNRYSNEVEV